MFRGRVDRLPQPVESLAQADAFVESPDSALIGQSDIRHVNFGSLGSPYTANGSYAGPR